jgi:Leucine-rich repeat (LRR) protein
VNVSQQRDPREQGSGVVFRSNRDGKVLLADQGFTEFPTFLLAFAHLVQLDLSDNYIAVVPDRIVRLTDLAVLVLTGNRIAELPQSLIGLDNLRLLHLAYNQISRISEEQLAGMPNLEELHVEFNHLTALPPLHTMTKLVGLSAEGNDFAAPGSIPSLPVSLEILWLKSAGLRHFPAAIDSCTALR